MATDLSAFTVYVSPRLLEILKTLAATDSRSLSNFVQNHLERSFGDKRMSKAYAFGMPVEFPSSSGGGLKTHVRNQAQSSSRRPIRTK